MGDGGSLPDRPTCAEGAAPVVIDAQVAGGASLLILALVAYLKSSLWRFFRVGAWLLAGREHTERRLVEAGIGPALALTPSLATCVEAAAGEGRPVYLAATRCSPLLDALAAHHPRIAGVILEPGAGVATSPGAAKFIDRFPDGFAAVVRRPDGIGVVEHAPRGALAPAFVSRSTAGAPPFPRASPLRELARGLRLHQCVKNTVVFVPLLLGGALADPAAIGRTILAFVALGCVASGTYLLNDIWDVADDRRHWSKRDRPVASGRLSAVAALAAALVLVGVGIVLGRLVSGPACAALLVYLGLTLSYTLYLKTVPFLDGLVLATLFTVRLGIGAAAAAVPASAWLLVFSMFLFSSLSYAKRYTEISRAVAHRFDGSNGRGYRPADAPVLLAVGLAAGIGAVTIMVLYIVEEAFRTSFYGNTPWLWGFPPLVFLFVVRIWLVSARGDMLDDPVAFAIADRTCITLLGLLSVCFAVAWLG